MNDTSNENASPTRRVLYIEDDDVYGQFVAAILSEIGFSVDLAESGEDGLRMYDAAPYDIVAVDFQLPGISGIETCRELRERSTSLPLVVITARGNASTFAEALTLDVPHYLEKTDQETFIKNLMNTFYSISKGLDAS